MKLIKETIISTSSEKDSWMVLKWLSLILQSAPYIVSCFGTENGFPLLDDCFSFFEIQNESLQVPFLSIFVFMLECCC